MIRFLIPVNFAPYTINALNYCAELANQLHGEITLLYCYTHLLSGDDNDNKENDTNVISSKEEAMLELEKLKTHITGKIKNNKHIIINKRLLDGYPEDAIQAFSEEYQPDIIVMGTKSKGETIKELLGSVTLDIIKNVSFPVMAVPNDYEVKIDQLTNILFVTDFEKCEYTPLHKLVRLVSAFETKIHNVQYCSSGKEKVDTEQITEYNEYCKTTYRNQNIICDYICGQDIFSASKEYIQNNNINLMAITRKKRSLISTILRPSVTKKILFNTEIPTLFFHQQS